MQTARQKRGAAAYQAGVAAEAQVGRRYERQGYRRVASRWRGTAGEIDLIVEQGDMVVFVEVKKARSFDVALERLRPRQIKRLYQTAEEYSGSLAPGRDMRFDLAVVNSAGQIETLENVFAM